jgi:glycerate 2-kinase
VRDVLGLLRRADLFTRIPQAQREYLEGVSRGTIPETPTQAHPAFAHVTARVVGNNRAAIDGVAAHARAGGLAADIIDTRLGGAAALAGETIARRLLDVRAEGASGRCLIWGGETTVALGGDRAGSLSGGGRCQELALAAARVLHDAGEGAAGITLLAAGTDGRDGATDASGALVDGATWQAITAAGHDPARALAAHESNGALRAARALIPRRETGTNVNDVVIGIL